MAKRRLQLGITLGALSSVLVIGCTVDQAKPTPTEEANTRQNLRQVRGSIQQFTPPDSGDPEGRGKIPSGR